MPSRDDLLFVKKLVNTALDAVQGKLPPSVINGQRGWRKAVFTELMKTAAVIREFEKADRNV